MNYVANRLLPNGNIEKPTQVQTQSAHALNGMCLCVLVLAAHHGFNSEARRCREFVDIRLVVAASEVCRICWSRLNLTGSSI